MSPKVWGCAVCLPVLVAWFSFPGCVRIFSGGVVHISRERLVNWFPRRNQLKTFPNTQIVAPSPVVATQLEKKKPYVRSLPSASQTISSAPMRLVVAGQSQISATHMLAHGQLSGTPLCSARLSTAVRLAYVSRAVRLRRMEGPRSHYSRRLCRYLVRIKCFLCPCRPAVFAKSHFPATKTDLGHWTKWLLIVVPSPVRPLSSARCCSSQKKPYTMARFSVLQSLGTSPSEISKGAVLLGSLGSVVMTSVAVATLSYLSADRSLTAVLGGASRRA